jgi:hypothetical protein
MNHYKIKLMILTLILLIARCSREKDELTLPVRVGFKMCFKIGFSQDSSLNTEYLDFNGCRIGIGKIAFTGRREAGGDYSFVSNPRNIPTLSSSWLLEPTTVSVFDMPQGIYTDMKWEMEVWAIPNEVLLDLDEGLTIEELLTAGVIEDWGEGIYAGPGIAISGTYKSLDGSVIPFLYAYDPPPPDYKLRAESFDPDGNSRIVFSVDKEYESTMLFTLEYDSRSANRELFEEAKISGDSGHPVIIISDRNNQDLYENLKSTIILSIKVIIKETGSSTV